MSQFGPGVDFCGRLNGRLPFGKIGQMVVANGVIGAICSRQIDGVKRGQWSHL